jgi:DNA-directed RNA polymerase subunit RPC12/RpoP
VIFRTNCAIIKKQCNNMRWDYKKEEQTTVYNRCVCQKCGSHFATILDNDTALENESCPKCGEKQLKLEGSLSFSEISSLFSGGG